MKRIVFASALAAVILLSLSVSPGNASGNISTLDELVNPQPGCYCVVDPCCDCKSNATGNIYPGHRMVCDEQD